MKTARAAALQGPEEAPELIVDNEIRNPPPLDHRIASVWMRTPTNNVSDGYDLLLSASFGQERVTLKGDGFVIDADFSLSTADIELKFLKCSPTVLEEEGRADEARTIIKDQLSEATRWNVSTGADATASTSPASAASLRAGGKYEKSATATTTTQRSASSFANVIPDVSGQDSRSRRSVKDSPDEGHQQPEQMRRDGDRRLTLQRASARVELFEPFQATVRADLDASQQRHVPAGQHQRPPQERSEAVGAGEPFQGNPQPFTHQHRFMHLRTGGGLARCQQSPGQVSHR